MKVLIYPADDQGCGHHRLIWPGEALRAAGHDVTVVSASDRQVRVGVTPEGEVRSVDVPDGVDVVVLQRITHRWLGGMVRVLRERGVTVVIDVDDDLTSIHPGNLAFTALHPRSEGGLLANGRPNMHSWHHLTAACRSASLVTVSSPALLPTYAAHGRGVVIRNYLADHYYEPTARPRATDRGAPVVGWPASLHSHPNDPDAVGPAVARLVADGSIEFVVIGDPTGTGRAFGMTSDPPSPLGVVPLLEWPRAVATLDVGVCPLADTRFNAAKSWLKPLELAAVGVPWVGSPRTEYRALHALGCGVLADRPRDWHRALRDVTSESRRLELAEAGRSVAATLRLRDHAWRWLEAWESAVARDRAVGRPSSPPRAAARRAASPRRPHASRVTRAPLD